MRLKHVKGAEERIAESCYVIPEDEGHAGHWNEVFGNDHPIYLEIGMGKGRFLLEQARQHPEINYIGIEKYSSVLLRAVQKRDEEPYRELSNIQFLRMDAEEIRKTFAKGEISRIYLNFSDPWPKDRHAKRRLTSRCFLRRYEDILTADAVVEFKTDNSALFTFSLAEVEEAGWKLVASTLDLHHDPAMNQDNIMTEYEEKFSAKGNPIFKMIARQKVGES